jgi:hypothetical protein
MGYERNLQFTVLAATTTTRTGTRTRTCTQYGDGEDAQQEELQKQIEEPLFFF